MYDKTIYEKFKLLSSKEIKSHLDKDELKCCEALTNSLLELVVDGYLISVAKNSETGDLKPVLYRLEDGKEFNLCSSLVISIKTIEENPNKILEKEVSRYSDLDGNYN